MPPDVLRIFYLPLKIRRLRPGLNPRTWVPKANTLPLDHRSRWDTKLNENLVQGLPPNWIISFLEVYKELVHCLIVFPFFLKYLTNTEYMINSWLLRRNLHWWSPITSSALTCHIEQKKKEFLRRVHVSCHSVRHTLLAIKTMCWVFMKFGIEVISSEAAQEPRISLKKDVLTVNL